MRTPQFIEAWGRDRVAKEDELLRCCLTCNARGCCLRTRRAAYRLAGLTHSLLLAYCASPRANHALRTVPPELIKPYAEAHDAAVWGTLQACLGEPAKDAEIRGARGTRHRAVARKPSLRQHA